MAEFKPINTQEEFDAAIKDRIERAERSVEQKYADYGKLKDQITKLEDEKKALETRISGFDQEKADVQKKLDEALQKTKDLEKDALKTNAAIEAGLPLDLRNRLTGETAEAIKADAENLVKIVGGGNSGMNLPGFKGTDPVGDDKDRAYRDMLKGFNLN